LAIDTTALGAIRYNDAGLVPAIVQSVISKRVLMMAWMNSATLSETLELGEAVFWSRSRNERWHKGSTSGNTQRVISIESDCDGDTLLLHVLEAGAACHNGTESCFDSATLFIANDADEVLPAGIRVDEVDS
jgi:phosphoribosyl-AMP cyclohydrolase